MADQGIPVIGPILNKIIGTRNERFVKRYTQRVDAINALEPQMRALTDAQLRAKLGEFRERAKKAGGGRGVADPRIGPAAGHGRHRYWNRHGPRLHRSDLARRLGTCHLCSQRGAALAVLDAEIRLHLA